MKAEVMAVRNECFVEKFLGLLVLSTFQQIDLHPVE
jgi:hypothetical protein